MMLRWIPAELHTHTFHSDGSQSLQELAQAAKGAGIDVIALTDHNTQSGLIDRNEVEASTGIRIMAGMEWTTFYGHMVTLGLLQYVDWRAVGQGDIEQGISQVHEAGGIAGIAHPFRIGSPICTGCYWEYPIHDWSQVDYIEVWSTLMPFMKQDSQRAFALWTSLLDEGHRLAATSGRDWHRTLPDDAPAAITYIGLEATAERFCEEAEQQSYDDDTQRTMEEHMQSGIDAADANDDSGSSNAWQDAETRSSIRRLHDRQYIEAIRNGKLTITMGPVLDLYAVVCDSNTSNASTTSMPVEESAIESIRTEPSLFEANENEYSVHTIGDIIASGVEQLRLHLQLDRRIRSSHYELAAQKLRVVIMSDRGILAETRLDSEQPWQEWTVQIQAPARWLRAELYGYFNEVCGMLAFTNAIYIDGTDVES